MKSVAPPLLVALLYCSTSLLWFVITPPFEAPDENAHFAFARYLAVERRLPDSRNESRVGWDSHEWIQPPLYYLLLAPVIAIAGADAEPAVPTNVLNNRFHGGSAKRMFLWDGQRSVGGDAIFYARLASLLLGGVTVLLIYKAAASVLVDRAQAAVAAASLTLVPQYTFLAAAVTNDTLATTLSAATVASLVTIWGRRKLPMITAGVAGLLAGAAFITKISTAFLFPMIALAAVCRSRGQRARAFAFLVVAGAGVAVSSGWYFVRNMIVFGDPLATRFKEEIVADVATPLHLSVSDLLFHTRFPADLFLSFWGSFGWLTISTTTEALWGYAVITGLLVGVMAAYGVALIRSMHSGRAERVGLAVVAAGLAIVWAWRADRFSFMVGLPQGLVSSHPQAAGLFAAASFICVILASSPHPIDSRERQIALTLIAGIVMLAAELVGYNTRWPGASQSRLIYPGLAPMVIVLALAVRHAGAGLLWPGLKGWLIPTALAVLGVAWVISFSAGVRGFHLVG